MATPQEKLAQSLKVLKDIQDNEGFAAIKTSEISRTHRERLLKNGFIKEVIKGWYISAPPDEKEGDSTSWYANYWKFCARYLQERFGNRYSLSPEQSLELHAGNWSVPQQLIIRTTKDITSKTDLPYGTSLFAMKSPLPENANTVVESGIRMLSLPDSIVYCTPSMFTNSSIAMRAALALIKDSSEILGILLEGGHSTIAGRLAGAFRNTGQDRIADEIIKTMKVAGYDVRENDPFDNKPSIRLTDKLESPYVNRIRLMWHSMREVVISNFPEAPGIPKSQENYLKLIEDIYLTDAYHSLSIEKYRVTTDLIERVGSGDWEPEENEADRRQRDAMAARGYWQAFQAVKESVERVLNGENAGVVVDEDHGAWYRELFAPSVTAGFLKASDLAGYRSDQVYIGQSRHIPMKKEAVRDVMPAFFDLLKNEESAAVRAVLGHFVFVFIHPYMDGNGRMGRFLMNVMLASGGYPWTVIPVEERDRYMKALEAASVDKDIKDFTSFIAWLVGEGLKGTSVAKV